MALPPTAFKDLLTGSYDEIYERLREKGCLSDEGVQDRDAVLAVMQASAQAFAAWVREHPRMTGPNSQDRLAEALLGSPYVNAYAHRLSLQDTR